MYRREFMQHFLSGATSLIMARTLHASAINTKTQKELIPEEINDFKKYRFDNFVVNDGNWTAYLTLTTIAKKVGSIAPPSPLCLFGGAHSGKTHLLNAFKNNVAELHPDISCSFMNASSISRIFDKNHLEDNIHTLKQRLLFHDILLIDDIHLLIGKHRLINGMNEQHLLLDITESFIRNKKTVIFTHSRRYSPMGWVSSHIKCTLTRQRIILYK